VAFLVLIPILDSRVQRSRFFLFTASPPKEISLQFMPSSNQQVADGLEVFRDNSPALAYRPYDRYPPEGLTNQPLELRQNRERRRICGVPVLWIIVAILIFIVGGAIGGGVGASVRLNEKSSR
jgi:hypothetical protein